MENNLSFDVFFDRARRFFEQHFKTIIAGSLVVIACAGGGTYYYFNSVNQEEAAFTILHDCLTQYVQAKDGKAQWTDVAQMCDMGYQKYKSTKSAEYIRLIQVNALLAQNQQDPALALLGQTISSLPASSSLYSYFQLQQALLRVDQNDDAQKAAGLQELQKLADNTKALGNDQARYYLGLYYKTHNEEAKAQEVWGSLVAVNETIADQNARSPWAALAQQKLSGQQA